MDVAAAAALIRSALRRTDDTWADLGAGGGTFTRALASLLGHAGRVIAVERDASAVAALRALARGADGGADAAITVVQADFTRPLDLPALDGVLLANALHFVPDADQPRVVAAVARHLRPGGRLAIVEYEGRRPSRWVPFPVSFARFVELARGAGLGDATRIGERRSAFGGTMYAAAAE
jgi:SAM-dependent methyltransferase